MFGAAGAESSAEYCRSDPAKHSLSRPQVFESNERPVLDRWWLFTPQLGRTLMFCYFCKLESVASHDVTGDAASHGSTVRCLFTAPVLLRGAADNGRSAFEGP